MPRLPQASYWPKSRVSAEGNRPGSTAATRDLCHDSPVDSAAINRLNWDERAPAHAASPDYHVASFITDPTFLSYVVQFDLPRLGELTGQRGLHLQCHIGTDTISLARLGATMTGLDFSPAALTEARRIAHLAGADVDFVQSDVYDAVSVLGTNSFDLVYTGIGALCWLPDIRRWAQTVAGLLRPGGRLFVREGHPMLWSLNEQRDDQLLVVDYPYFETAEPHVDDDDGTYVATDAAFAYNTTHTWNHGIAEIITALLDTGMELTAFEEHRSVPWEALPGTMICDERGEWRMRTRPERIPLTYTVQARKSA